MCSYTVVDDGCVIVVLLPVFLIIVLMHQTREQALLYAAASGSAPLITALLDDFGVSVNAMVHPGVCVDCDPVCLMSACRHGHGIGKETALMSAALSGHWDMIDLLCASGAEVNLQNEVRPALLGKRCCVTAVLLLCY